MGPKVPARLMWLALLLALAGHARPEQQLVKPPVAEPDYTFYHRKCVTRHPVRRARPAALPLAADGVVVAPQG